MPPLPQNGTSGVATGPQIAPSPTVTPTPQVNSQLDPQLVNLAKAIRQTESQGNFQAQGASGEYGAYQFLPSTWSATAPKYGVNVPLNQATPEQQNEVAYKQLADWKTEHPDWNVGNFASAWNAGPGAPNAYLQNNVGTNAEGVKYDTPAYAQKVAENYQTFKTQGGTTPPDATQSPAAPTYGAPFPYQQGDNGLVAGFKALGNIPSSIYGLGAGIANSIMHPIQTAEGLGSAAIGGVENLTGENPGSPDQFQQTANAVGQALLQRYGGIHQLASTATNDPFGFGTDVASIIGGGAGLIGKGEELGNISSKVAQVVTNPISGVAGKVGSKVADAALSGANTDVLSAALRTGVTLPAGAYTDNSLIRSAQALAATGAGEASTVATIDGALAKMHEVANSLVASAGGSEDLTTAGENIAKGLKTFESAYNKANAANYAAITEAVGDPAAQTARPAAVIQKIIADKEAIADTKDLKFFKDKLAVLTGGKTDGEFVSLDPKTGKEIKSAGTQYAPPTFDTIKRLKTNLGQMIDKKFALPFVSENIVQLKQLYGALSDAELDTLRATGNKAVVSQYLKTKAAYIAGHNEIASQFGRKITTLAANGQYDKIIDGLIKPSMSVNDIPRILAVVGDRGAAEIQGGLMSKILEDSKDVHGEFTPKGILRQMDKYGDEKISAILKPEQVQGLKDLGTLSEALSETQKMALGAQAGFLVRQALQFRALGESGGIVFGIGDLLSGNIVGAAQKIGSVLGVEALSKFFASRTGQRFLTWGATHGTEFAGEAKTAGLHIDPVPAILPPNDSGTPGGNSAGVGTDSNIPSDTTDTSSGGTGIPPAGTPDGNGKSLLKKGVKSPVSLAGADVLAQNGNQN